MSIILLSAAIIAYQLVLMQVLAYTQWHHFAYLVISMALLGFGAAGSFLAVFRSWLLKHYQQVVFVSMTLTACLMAAGIRGGQSHFLRFDSLLLFSSWKELGKLLLNYLWHFLPFFLGALALGLVFVKEVAHIGKVYFANLLGSGLGGLLVLGLLATWQVELLGPLLALMVLLAALLMPPPGRLLYGGMALLSATVCGLALTMPVHLSPSQFKDLSYALSLPDAQVILQEPGVQGKVEVVSSPALRAASGLSLIAGRAVPAQPGVFLNGDGLGFIYPWSRGDSQVLADFSVQALPYTLGHRKKVLLLEPGGGAGLAQALTQGAREIRAVSSHGQVLKMLQGPLAYLSDSLWLQPQVKVHAVLPRSYLLWDSGSFDLIQLPMQGEAGAAAGLDALQEQSLYTREAFGGMWERLTEEGGIAVVAGMEQPLRKTLRLAATLVETLEGAGIEAPEEYLAAIRGWGTLCFFMKKTPLTVSEVKAVGVFCDSMGFDLLWLPGLTPEQRKGYYHELDPQTLACFDRLLEGPESRARLYREYAFRIEPVTDDRPYFSQTLRVSQLGSLWKTYGEHGLPYLELGYAILWFTLLQVVVLALLLILVPLRFLPRKGSGGMASLLYFSGLGLGYMFLEMVLIQRFSLYFGHPLYATSLVLATLLLCSGAGSYFSDRIRERVKRLGLLPAGIAGMVLLMVLFLPPLLNHSMSWGSFPKLLLFFAVVGPVAFLMGMPFPMGLGRIAALGAGPVAWAWGINGCLSVLSTVLATLLAVEAGFTLVLLGSALGYGLSAITATKLYHPVH